MFMIDIDNKPAKPKGMSKKDYNLLCQEYIKNKHRSYEDIIDHCNNIGIVPAFIYTSFSHQDNWHKMRLVFVLDKDIADINIAKKIQLYLMDVIGEVDEQCKNLNRIYYGGTSIVYDSGNVLSSDRLIGLSKDIEVINNLLRYAKRRGLLFGKLILLKADKNK